MTRRPRVLVIEDNPAHAALVEQHVEDRYEVVVVTTRAAALVLLGLVTNGDAFDAVICDLRLPDTFSGRDDRRIPFLREVVEASAPARTIVLSGADEPVLYQCLKAGAFSIINKPGSRWEIRMRVAEAVCDLRRTQTTVGRLKALVERADTLTSAPALPAVAGAGGAAR